MAFQGLKGETFTALIQLNVQYIPDWSAQSLWVIDIAPHVSTLCLPVNIAYGEVSQAFPLPYLHTVSDQILKGGEDLEWARLALYTYWRR